MVESNKRFIGDFLKQVRREVILKDNEQYKLLGVMWYGKGMFLREEKYGKEIKAEKLYRVNKGDFVYNRLFAWKSSFAIVEEELDGCLVSNEFPTFEYNSEEIDPYYLLNYVLQPNYIDYVNRQSGGMSSVSRKRFKEEEFLRSTFPILPIIQQRETSDIIRRRKNDIDLLYSDFDYQSSHLSLLRQAILQEAVEGKLTDEWRKAHPELVSDEHHVARLLEKIKAEKDRLVKKGKIKKQKPLPPVTDAEKPFDLPEGWVWCRLGECSVNKDDARQPISQAERERKAKVYPYYGASGVIDKIDGYTHEGLNLLIGEDGANLVARSTPVAFQADGQYWVNNHAHVIGFIEDITLKYIEIYINAIDLSPYITGGFQPKLSQGNLNLIIVSFPPISEQKAIVERVDLLMAMVDELEAQVEERKEKAERLMQAVLREAFEG